MYHGWNGGGFARGGFPHDAVAQCGYSFGFPWGGLVMGILVLAVIALLVVLIVRQGKSGKPDNSDLKERGIDILIERYTRGEIDADTFKTMKAELDARV